MRLPPDAARAARQAAGLIGTDAASAIDQLFDNPVIYLAKRGQHAATGRRPSWRRWR